MHLRTLLFCDSYITSGTVIAAGVASCIHNSTSDDFPGVFHHSLGLFWPARSPDQVLAASAADSPVVGFMRMSGGPSLMKRSLATPRRCASMRFLDQKHPVDTAKHLQSLQLLLNIPALRWRCLCLTSRWSG
jgi:hypothetical protein